MAKKKGKREEAFTFPEFNRAEYRAKEVRDSKVALFAIFYAIFVAGVCYFIVRMTDIRGLVMILGFIAPFGLIPILPFLTDTSEFERKNWFGPMFMSFMAWLGLFILLSNPPFNDIAKPMFQQMVIYTEDEGEWNTTLQLDKETPFLLLISVKDNGEIASVQISGSKDGSGSDALPRESPITKLEEGNQFGISADNNKYYYYDAEGLKNVGAYSFTFEAVDEEGNSRTKQVSFVVV